jgi:hypothetical protein
MPVIPSVGYELIRRKNHFPVQDTGQYHFSRTICSSKIIYQKVMKMHIFFYRILWENHLLLNITCMHGKVQIMKEKANDLKKKKSWPGAGILATQEAEIRRIKFQSQPQANSSPNPILIIPNTKKCLVEWIKW